jgi:microcompartment protein CcmK/EutM
MLTATVVGNVWSTRRLAEIPNGAFLEVEAEGSGTRLVAFDVLGSGVGERVLVAQGSVAAAWFPGKAPPIDALIIGSIDEPAGGGRVTKERGRQAAGGSGGSPPGSALGPRPRASGAAAAAGGSGGSPPGSALGPRPRASGAAAAAGSDKKKGKADGG